MSFPPQIIRVGQLRQVSKQKSHLWKLIPGGCHIVTGKEAGGNSPQFARGFAFDCNQSQYQLSYMLIFSTMFLGYNRTLFTDIILNQLA